MPYNTTTPSQKQKQKNQKKKKTLKFSIWQAGIETVFFAERINFIDETEH